MKHIETNHPVDPDTKEPFSLFEHICVKDYAAKIAGGVFMCYGCITCFRTVKKSCKRRLNPDTDTPFFRKFLFEKVPSLSKIMSVSEEDSSEDDDKAARGINLASRNLSEAAFLYL